MGALAMRRLPVVAEPPVAAAAAGGPARRGGLAAAPAARSLDAALSGTWTAAARRHRP